MSMGAEKLLGIAQLIVYYPSLDSRSSAWARSYALILLLTESHRYFLKKEGGPARY